MPRKNGSFEYTEEHEKLLLDNIIDYHIPKSTKVIEEEARSKLFAKINYRTVVRLLESMHKKGLVKCIKMKQVHLWTK